MQVTEAERQALITIRCLSPDRPCPRDQIEEFRELILGDDLIEWGDALETLLQRELLLNSEDGLTLSVAIKEEVDRLHQEWSADGFSKALIRCEESAAYSEYCRRLYGKNLCQFNMMDMRQLGKLMEVLALGPASRVLDLGCGIGAIAEYLSDATGAMITGTDFAAGAIHRARDRTVAKRDRLRFEVQSMDCLDFPAESFDMIIAIDALYFVRSLDATIGQCKELLEQLRVTYQRGNSAFGSSNIVISTIT